jgi:uncharacterized protein YkwD
MLSRLLAAIFLASLFFPSTAGQARAAENRCLPETGKCVGGRFLEYWTANGGLAQQGLPLTDEFPERSPLDGKVYTVQYFERARFEHHPENKAPHDVLLGLLGLEQYRAKYAQAAPPAGGQLAPAGVCRAFPETGRTACGPFLAYWQGNGGLAQQGLPLTDVFTETNPTDGKPYQVQYFERARFEYHPENKAPYDVLLGLLGREQFAAKYAPNAQEERVAQLLRAASGQRRASLTPNPVLARVARERAGDMAGRRYFDHVTPDGLGPNAIVRAAGYPLPAFYGQDPTSNNIESIGAGYRTPEAVVEGWLASESHRAHVLGLDPLFAEQIEYGIGYVADPTTAYGHYWVLITAKRGP